MAYKHSRSPDHGLPTWEMTNQSRLIGQPLKSSQFDYIDPEQETAAEETAEGEARGGEGSGRLQPMHGINPFVGPGLESNPAVSEKQRRFMAMCAHDPSAARGKCPSKSVASEFDHT